MASGNIPNETHIIQVTSPSFPTTTQLQNAKIVIVWLANKNTASRCTITDFVGTGEGMVSNQDVAGTYQTAWISWNKTNGTLFCDANNTIYSVCLIF